MRTTIALAAAVLAFTATATATPPKKPVPLPETRDWLTAVRVVQRVYPGSQRWLIACSATEGGHGGFVMNRQGSGAAGWMQFLTGTFWRMYGAARADAQARGFRLPASAASIGSPLGQALAAGWGWTNGRRGEWYGTGC